MSRRAFRVLLTRNCPVSRTASVAGSDLLAVGPQQPAGQLLGRLAHGLLEPLPVRRRGPDSTKVIATAATGQPVWSRTAAATEARESVTSPDSAAMPSWRTRVSSARSSPGVAGPVTAVREVKSARLP